MCGCEFQTRYDSCVLLSTRGRTILYVGKTWRPTLRGSPRDDRALWEPSSPFHTKLEQSHLMTMMMMMILYDMIWWYHTILYSKWDDEENLFKPNLPTHSHTRQTLKSIPQNLTGQHFESLKHAQNEPTCHFESLKHTQNEPTCIRPANCRWFNVPTNGWSWPKLTVYS